GAMYVPVANLAVISLSSQRWASTFRVNALACSRPLSSTYLARQRLPLPWLALCSVWVVPSGSRTVLYQRSSTPALRLRFIILRHPPPRHCLFGSLQLLLLTQKKPGRNGQLHQRFVRGIQAFPQGVVALLFELVDTVELSRQLVEDFSDPCSDPGYLPRRVCSRAAQ